VYVDIRSNSGNSVGLSLAVVGSGDDRLWDVKVSQIECSNPMV
jgi:hypothetical protein